MQMRRAPRAGGAGALAEVEDARGALSAAAGGALPGGAAVQLGCMYSVEADQLWLAAGSAAGAAAIFPVAEPGAGGRACAFGAPAAALQGGHTDVRPQAQGLRERLAAPRLPGAARPLVAMHAGCPRLLAVQHQNAPPLACVALPACTPFVWRGAVVGSTAGHRLVHAPGRTSHAVTLRPREAGRQVVRAVLWPDTSAALCFTGGEDARVCLWDAAGAAEPRAAVPRAKKHHGLGKRQRAV